MKMPNQIRAIRTSQKYEPLLEGASERIRAAVRELRDLRVIDENGNLLRTDLPDDMKRGLDRASGG